MLAIQLTSKCFRAVLVPLAVLAAGLLAADTCRAQFGGGGNVNGMFGQRNLGGGSQFGRTGAGAGGMGVPNAAQGAALTGNERFLEQNRRGAFVGADSGDAGNARTTGGLGGGMQGMNLFGNQGLFSQLNRQQQFQNGMNGAGQGRTQLRVRLTMGNSPGPVRPVPTSRVVNGFVRRLNRLPALQLAGPIEATLDGPTLVLRGEVASEGDRQLIEDLASLEPEVTAVRNELVVRGEELPAEELPAPTNASPALGR